ncbi:MAG TPA: hypothetical protein VGR02_13780 [Thermoanaerobaculia bacterium]|jgi:hypothetical protein|nr:hypothetical protein [Thermoanaerobaculia bacterium]
MKGQDKVIVPLKYKVQTTVNQVVPDSVLTRQSRKMHEPHGEEDERRAGR